MVEPVENSSINTTALRAGPDAADFARMADELREELAQSIYTLLAEELFLALLRKRDISDRIKRRTADQLITIWDDVALEIDDFAPLLESAWHARNRVHSDYGTLLGASETFRLVSEDCHLAVVDFFARDNMGADESAAIAGLGARRAAGFTEVSVIAAAEKQE